MATHADDTPDDGAGTTYELQDIVDDIRRRWGANRPDEWSAYFALSVLDDQPTSQRWVRSMRALVEFRDKERREQNKPPDDWFTVTDLLSRNAKGEFRFTEDQLRSGEAEEIIASLVPLTVTAVRELNATREHRFRVAEYEKSQRAQEQARRNIAAEKAALLGDPLDGLGLACNQGDVPPAESICGPIDARTIGTWFGAGGTAKSFAVLALACSVAAGRDFGDYTVPRARPVIYLCGETRKHGPAGDVRAWCQANEVEFDRLPVHVLDRTIQLADERAVDRVIEYAVNAEAALVILDTRSKSTVGLDENSANDAALINSQLQRIADAIDGSALVVHHSGKDGSGDARGSTASEYGMDYEIGQYITGKKGEPQPGKPRNRITDERLALVVRRSKSHEAGARMYGHAERVQVTRAVRYPDGTTRNIDYETLVFQPDHVDPFNVANEGLATSAATASRLTENQLRALRAYEAYAGDGGLTPTELGRKIIVEEGEDNAIRPETLREAVKRLHALDLVLVTEVKGQSTRYICAPKGWDTLIETGQMSAEAAQPRRDHINIDGTPKFAAEYDRIARELFDTYGQDTKKPSRADAFRRLNAPAQRPFDAAWQAYQQWPNGTSLNSVEDLGHAEIAPEYGDLADKPED
ncbi:AAA family ATPase [Tsukamurella paurometabola]|uniref:AAA family ATPase n=1 Tax=Tsukamurella paurometabola TaxID=2061 RepID=A0ABS5NHV9_TSUPA|nr:AAA family ATPase [Tsukamurella paurometabola]MBS4103886.1 AAA family ATPase [Tsukamurella paurometabola]